MIRVVITGDPALPHLIRINDAENGEILRDVDSFEVRAHVTEGVTCVLHRLTMKLVPGTNNIGRFDTEAQIAALHLESVEDDE